MRTWIHVSIACLFLLAAPSAWCTAAADAVPEATSLLVDQAGVLDPADQQSLRSRLQSIQDSGRAQVAILVSSGTGGAPLSEYTLRVAEAWALGRRGRDDGLLIVVVPSSNAARLEVGYGLEGVIPDARVSRWLDDLVPAIRKRDIAGGLDHLLDQVEAALPKATEPPTAGERELFAAHPEWSLPFVLTVFSVFAIFPLFFGPWGSVASGPLFAGMIGGAAWMLWGYGAATLSVGALAFVLPFLWSLNHLQDARLGRWLGYAKTLGNLMAVAVFFSVITLFVGVPLYYESQAEPALVWGAPFFSGLLALGLATFLFPGKPAQYLMIVLRSAMQFVFILVITYISLQVFIPHPAGLAAGAAAAVTAVIALGLYLDSRERTRETAGDEIGVRWSVWLFGLAFLMAIPFGLFTLVLAVGGEDLTTQLTQAAAGSGSIAGALALAARYGLFAAVKIGLGGRFGGGGAERSD